MERAMAALPTPEPRKGMPSPLLDEATFRQRFLARYIDPAFEPLSAELDKIAAAAWDAYSHHRKSPRTQKAGPGYADPNYDLAVDWIHAKAACEAAKLRHADKDGPCRVLIVNGSARSEHSCPGEMSKSFRMAQIAREAMEADDIEVTILDLSRLTSEYGREIHPCKACFSTAATLCHFPCSCYPNYSLGQTDDWMNEIYPLWVQSHGVMIITPVNWYMASSPMKLMMDRLVCCDGGNPDPTLTHGKDAKEAKAVELAGWDYPKQLSDRVFSVIVHGDVEGAENVRRSLSDWLRFMDMVPAGVNAELDRYIGYWEPYATNQESFDKDLAMQGEVRNAALTLAEAAHANHAGKLIMAGNKLKPPRQK
jgi:multimeric flavodoxin WrbA